MKDNTLRDILIDILGSPKSLEYSY